MGQPNRRPFAFDTFDVTDDYTEFANTLNARDWCAMGNYETGHIYIAVGDNAAGAATLTFYATFSAEAAMAPLYKADGSTAVTATIPTGAHTAGAIVPLPAECRGAFRIAVQGDDACTITISRQY